MALREVLSATGECFRRHRFLVPNWFFIPINHASEHARELPKVTTQCICNKLAAATEHTAVTLEQRLRMRIESRVVESFTEPEYTMQMLNCNYSGF